MLLTASEYRHKLNKSRIERPPIPYHMATYLGIKVSADKDWMDPLLPADISAVEK